MTASVVRRAGAVMHPRLEPEVAPDVRREAPRGPARARRGVAVRSPSVGAALLRLQLRIAERAVDRLRSRHASERIDELVLRLERAQCGKTTRARRGAA